MHGDVDSSVISVKRGKSFFPIFKNIRFMFPRQRPLYHKIKILLKQKSNCLQMNCIRRIIHIKNWRRGPITLPCATPDITSKHEDACATSSTITRYFAHSQKLRKTYMILFGSKQTALNLCNLYSYNFVTIISCVKYK